MYQLVIQFPLRSAAPQGADLDMLLALESELDRTANGAFDVDGHDAGSGEMNIFILTEDVEGTFKAIRSKLPDDAAWRAGFRDPGSDTFTPLAPAGLVHFDVQ